MQKVLLLKTQSHPTDPYDTFFRLQGLDPIFIPVLRHRHVNLDTARRIIREGQIEGLGKPAAEAEYGGVIVTSQRAVEALGEVLESLQVKSLTNTGTLEIAPSASSLPIYVVGPATERSIGTLGFSGGNIHGAHCGNGQELADYIVGHYYTSTKEEDKEEKQEKQEKKKKLLFLVGEVHRDAIPKTLRAAGLSVDVLVVYDTQVVESFGADLARALGQRQRRRGDGDGDMIEEEVSMQKLEEQKNAVVAAATTPRWVVVFSPTGAETAMEVLGYKRHGPRSNSSSSSTGTAAIPAASTDLSALPTTRRTYITTIGPTTASHLRGLGVEPDAVAAAPSPNGLWTAMAQFLLTIEDGSSGSLT